MKSEKHNEELELEIKRLQEKGFRVINLNNKSPDAIAIKGDKIYAIKVLGLSYYKKKYTWKGSYSIRQLLKVYHMFDGIIIKNFYRKAPEGIRKPKLESKHYPTPAKKGGIPLFRVEKEINKGDDGNG